ncbi:MAG: hypothetical protein ABUR63_02000 [Verrucomicrobiota bacterium]
MPPDLSRQSAGAPAATFLGSLALRVESPAARPIPGAVQVSFQAHGRLQGPALNGRLSGCAGSLEVDSDGVGYLRLEGPLELTACPALLQASGRCDFGPDGRESAQSGRLPPAGATLMVRVLTTRDGCTALNRSLAVAVGRIDVPARSLTLDLFSMAPAAASAPATPFRTGPVS